MSDFYCGLPLNYISHPLYQQYATMLADAQQQYNMMRQQAIAQQQLFAQQQQAAAQQQAIAQQQALAQQQAAAQQQALAQQSLAQTQPTFAQGQDATVSTAKDGKDDGKIGFWDKCKNFGKGIGKFFTGMVCDENGKFSIKRTLTTVAVAAGAVALTVATGGAATPFLIAAGATMGAFEVGKGAYKAATAKTDAEAEAAWQSIGSGTTAVVASVAGAKSALKSANVAVPKGNAVTSSLKATAKCFQIAGKGVYNGGKSAIFHPIKSFNNVRAYYNNVAKPNLTKAFSYKTGHKNYTDAMEQKLNKSIDKIDAEIKALNDELLTNPSEARVAEINSKISNLENQKIVNHSQQLFNNSKQKGIDFLEKQITEVEAKLADSTISVAEKNRLSVLREQLYEVADILDTKYKIGVNNSFKARENYINILKEQLKTATGDDVATLKSDIQMQESVLKALNSQKKIEIAQHNIQQASTKIKNLEMQLKTTGLSDVQKEAITSRIAKLQSAITKDKNVLRFANAKIAAKNTLPQVGLAYGSYYLANHNNPSGQIDEMNAYAQANGFQSYQQMMDYVNAMNNSQQALDNSQAYLDNNSQAYLDNNSQAPANYNNFGYTNLFNQQQLAMPQQNNLSFNDLYVSPYPEYI